MTDPVSCAREPTPPVGTVPLGGATASALTHSWRALHAVRARLPR